MSDRPTKSTVTGRFAGGGLFEPKDGQNRHNALVILDQGQEHKVQGVINNAIANRWGNKPPQGIEDWGVREGDDQEFAPSFGKLFINPKGQKVSVVLKHNGHTLDVRGDDDIIYPGCYVAASINAYAYDADKIKGIKPGASLDLRAVMFLKDGTPFGDRVDVDAAFDAFESDALSATRITKSGTDVSDAPSETWLDGVAA